jgi:hypothetical protein
MLDPIIKHDPVVDTAMQEGQNCASEMEAMESPSLQSHKIISLQMFREVNLPVGISRNEVL